MYLGDEAIKYEFYCENSDPEQLKDYCYYAIHKNKRFSKRKKVRWEVDRDEQPHCEFRTVDVKEFKYETSRTLLRCPVLVAEKGKKPWKSNMFIMSVENAPSSRLVFYLFMVSSSGAPLRIEDSSQSQSRSIEYEKSRASTGSIYDLSERDRERISKIEPARSSFSTDIDQSTVARSSKNFEIEEVKPARAVSTQIDKGKSIAENKDKAPDRTHIAAPVRKLSIRDYGPTRATASRPADFKPFQTAQSNISEYHFNRSSTLKKINYQNRRASLPSRKYSRDKRGHLKRLERASQEQSSEPGAPLEIVSLLINRRHTIGHQRNEDKLNEL